MMPEERYWRGAGNWNDSSKWSAFVSGPTGASVPTAENIVIFDGTSSDCTLDVNANCKEVAGWGYTGSLDLNDFNLDVEEDFNLGASSTIVMGSGALKINKSGGSSSRILGSVTRETGVLDVGSAYTGGTIGLDLNAKAFYRVRLARNINLSVWFSVWENLYLDGGGSINTNDNQIYLRGDTSYVIAVSSMNATELLLYFTKSGAGTNKIQGNWTGVTGAGVVSITYYADTGSGSSTLSQECHIEGSQGCIKDLVIKGAIGSSAKWNTNGYKLKTKKVFQYITVDVNGHLDTSSGAGGTTTIECDRLSINAGGAQVTQGNALIKFRDTLDTRTGTWTKGTGTVTKINGRGGEFYADGTNNIGDFVMNATVGSGNSLGTLGKYITDNFTLTSGTFYFRSEHECNGNLVVSSGGVFDCSLDGAGVIHLKKDMTAASGTIIKGTETWQMEGYGYTADFAVNDINNLTIKDAANLRATGSDSGHYFKISGTYKARVSATGFGIFHWPNYFEANAIDWLGLSGNLLYIYSTIGTFYLKVNAASPVVSYVWALNCDASAGSTIDADDGTNTDAGGNTNWDFTP